MHPAPTARAAASTDAPDPRFLAKLRSYEGAASAAGRGKDPVNEPMIRHWCEAMGDANPVYTDPRAAAATHFGGLIAPPAMLQAWTMDGLSGRASSRTVAYGELLGMLDDAGFTSVVATDCEQEYLRPLRPGDQVEFAAVIESVSAQKRTRLGTGHFVTTRMDVRVGGDLVGTHRFRILKYRPRKQPPVPPIPAPAGAPASAPASAPAPVPDPAAARRPRPVINRDNAGFWDGVAEHRLLIQRCTACRALRFPWLPGCNGCGSPDWEPVEARGDGTVYSYVVMHHPSFRAFDPPYAVALVELAEGVRMISNVVGVPHTDVAVGMPVSLAFQRVDDELTLPVFRPRDGA